MANLPSLPSPEEAFNFIVDTAKETWGGMDAGDKASLVLGPVPVVGDAMGLVNDLRNYATGRQEVTPTNVAMTALGVLPFVPSGLGGAIKKEIIRPAPIQKAKDYIAWERDFLKNNPGISELDMGDPKLALQGEKATKAWRGPDGIIRDEIDDSSMRIRTDHLFKQDTYGNVPGTGLKKFPSGEQARVEDYMKGFTPEHLGMHLDKVPTHKISERDVALGTRGEAASVYGDKFGHQKSIAVAKTQDDVFEGVMKHELQHVVQGLYGMERGGNSLEFISDYNPKSANEAHQRYLSLYGEAEARAVQNRGNLSQPEREMKPFNQQILNDMAMNNISDLLTGEKARSLPKFGK